ncbi:MAG: tyrosyl-tRNA synthetase [Parcubacteria group bacterium Licking1014_1]|nr:MAG: tyrosyl-tRNA synthetase [Parcubacteria group bacterium Licking1014_1]
MINTNSKKIGEILSRGVENIIEKESLEARLKSGKQLRIKHGIDPTGPKIHIGRAFQFWKLRDFQELGHKIILIIGDFTAAIGDASDKQAMRKPLAEKEIKENMKDYKKQIGKILDMKKVELRYNSEWFNKMKVKEFVFLQMLFTAQQTIQRRNFKERWDSGKSIGLHELDYPLFQGYDSVMVKADIETGGSDQLFNLKAGREIQKIFKQKSQDIITSKMLNGLDGRKMSTSWGNIITILDAPQDMYGKIMSIKDELIDEYFELATRLSKEEIEKIKKSSNNPRDIKAGLAKEIVALYYGKNKAQIAKNEFNKIFRNKELPTDIPVFETSKNPYPILDLLFDAKLASSKNEAKRLVEGKGVEIQIGEKKEKISDWKKEIILEDGIIIKVGSRRFVKIHQVK